MEKLAIIGSGIAGLGCAHLLNGRYQLTFFEQNDYPGGHSNTVDVVEKGRKSPVDTGFMVFNEVTYPKLCRLFRELGVESKPTDMSFSVMHQPSGLEFSGSSLNHLFAQRRNLANPRFWSLLWQINRFNAEAAEALTSGNWGDRTLADYVAARAYGEDFRDRYLIPMGSAVWSTPPDLMMQFPAATLLRFFHNHGFLGMHTQHPWLTLKGGARSYVRQILKRLNDPVLLNRKVVAVDRDSSSATVATDDGKTHRFDRVILATHADQSLRLLQNPEPIEQRLLDAFKYQANRATLHTDGSLMPDKRLAWSSWNYRVRYDQAGRIRPMTIYWMNRLQGVSDTTDYFVSVNGQEEIDPERIIKSIDYEHPVFSLDAMKAQDELHLLNRRGPENRLYFCGAWFKYGFHEDGFSSALDCSRALAGEKLWT